MTTLVTGGRGFVGRHLVDLLLSRGEKVVSYNRDYAVDNRPNLQMAHGELFDIPTLVRTLNDNAVERIIHTAGMSHPGLSVDCPITTFAANVDGTLSVYEAARMAGIRRVVNFSSECAYGTLDESQLVYEDVKPMPTTPYGVTKVAGELLGKVYNELYGMQIVSLRITEVYGPGLWMPSLLGDMLSAAVSGEAFSLDSGGDHRFQFVFVDDVASAAYLASRAESPTQFVYHVSGGSQVTLEQAAAVIRVLVPGAQISLGGGHLEQWDRQGEFDLSASRRDLSYEPEWSLQDGLTESIRSIRALRG